MIKSKTASWLTPANAKRAGFFANGAAIGAWAPLVPLARARLDLNEGSLGILLLAMGIGGLITMPLSGPLVALRGYRQIILTAFFISTITLAPLAILGSFASMFIALLIFGMAIGLTDVAMNMHAAKVESTEKRALMSGFHGMWSVGAFFGATAMTLFLSAKLSPLLASLIIIALCLVVALPFRAAYIHESPAVKGEPLFVIPKGIVIYLGVLCFILYFSEHAILDWGGVLMNTMRGVPIEQAGFGYACFAASMTVMRFLGDRLRDKMGDKYVMLIGGVMAASGYAMIAIIPVIWLDYAGFMIAGAGIANLVPIIFSVAGRTKIMPPHLALTAVATVSFAGLLFGPGLIGFIAHQTSLTFSFLMLSALLMFVALSFRIISKFE